MIIGVLTALKVAENDLVVDCQSLSDALCGFWGGGGFRWANLIPNTFSTALIV